MKLQIAGSVIINNIYCYFDQIQDKYRILVSEGSQYHDNLNAKFVFRFRRRLHRLHGIKIQSIMFDGGSKKTSFQNVLKYK